MFITNKEIHIFKDNSNSFCKMKIFVNFFIQSRTDILPNKIQLFVTFKRGSGGQGFISGVGETELQLQHRRIQEMRNGLLVQIEEVCRTRALHRSSRRRHGCPSGQGLATVAVILGHYRNITSPTRRGANEPDQTQNSAQLFNLSLKAQLSSAQLRRVKPDSARSIGFSRLGPNSAQTQLIVAKARTIQYSLYCYFNFQRRVIVAKARTIHDMSSCHTATSTGVVSSI